MSSITSILNRLPFGVAPRKELYRHPNVPDYHNALCGTFHDAIEDRKALATCVFQPFSHAMTLINITDEKIILKDTYSSLKTCEYSLDENTPYHGYCVTFKPISKRQSNDDELFSVAKMTLLNLQEMGFDEPLITETLLDSPEVAEDLDAAVQALYNAQRMTE